MKRYCRFISVSKLAGWHDAFFIEDGGSILIDGKEETVTYIDQEHFLIGLKCFHISEFYYKVGKYHLVLPGKGLKTKKYGPNYNSYLDGTYEKILIPDIKLSCDFSNLRIIRETIPLGKYAYDLRYDDEGRGIASEIAEYVLINHLGTIVSEVPILKPKQKIYLEKDIEFI